MKLKLYSHEQSVVARPQGAAQLAELTLASLVGEKANLNNFNVLFTCPISDDNFALCYSLLENN